MPLTVDKINIATIYLAAAICAFLYADTYLMPVKSSWHNLDDMHYYQQKRYRSGTNQTYEFVAGGKRFDVTGRAYNMCDRGDSILIARSRFSGVVQQVSVIKEGEMYSYNISFINARLGIFFLPILAIALIPLRLFYYKLKTESVRNKLATMVFIWALVLLLFYTVFS